MESQLPGRFKLISSWDTRIWTSRSRQIQLVRFKCVILRWIYPIQDGGKTNSRCRHLMFHLLPMIPPDSIKLPTQLPISQPPPRQSATALLLAHRFSTLPRKHHKDNFGSYCRLTPLLLAPTMGLRFKLGPRKRLTQNGLTARNPSHDYFSHCFIRKISILLKLNCYLGCVEVCAFATAKIRRLNGDAIAKKTTL